ncbi:DegT/DnrJ/EryC1/StrS family aminotransferase [Patescibacteria group bacterium]|nr:DegT/DnrJ/EryC1/StrS family aminotransferase [Patescibacteria group bacterium]
MNIPLSSADITEKEYKAVLSVLKTKRIALGPKLKEFEKEFARYIGTKYAIAVNAGTSGLHLVVRSLGIKKGDEVITTPFSFIASANCILFEQAKPVFVDIDPQTLNMDPAKIEKAITRKTKAILAVDIFGHPVDWTPILKIGKKYKLKIIEDSCEALGAEYKGKKCGTFGQAAVFAFYPNKQMTTGEGGLIVTNNKKIHDLCRSMMNQGREVKGETWLEHVRLGYNYRMSDINAALGLTQILRIKQIIKKRDQVAQTYNHYLSKIPNIQIPYVAPWAKISWFVYVIQLTPNFTRKKRDQILKKLQKSGIQCSNYFQCIHLQPFYRKLFGYKRGDFPIAESVSERTIALPFYNDLTEKQIKYIVKKVETQIIG